MLKQVTKVCIRNVREQRIDTRAGERRISRVGAISGFGAKRRGPVSSSHPGFAPAAEKLAASHEPRPAHRDSTAGNTAAGRTV